MNTPGFTTPKRRPITPGRRDRVLPSFNSPASIRIGRMLDSAYRQNSNDIISYNNDRDSLENELPGDIIDGIAATAVTSTSEEYDPPRVWFQREDDKKQNQEFTRRVDEMVQELKRLIRERQSEHIHQVNEGKDRETRMAHDMEALEKENSTIMSALKSELSREDDLSKTISGLQATQKQVIERTAQLAKEKSKLEADFHHKQDELSTRRGVIATQAAKNKPELEFFKSKMGLSIVSGGQNDMLNFVFTQISMVDPQRPFTITVDLSQHDYRAPKCKPNLPNLQSHLDWLNMTRDFFGFLKRIRKEFANHYITGII